MPTIVPIRDLKNTARIDELCQSTDAPIFVTKNGYGTMVLMSMKHYETLVARDEMVKSLARSRTDFKAGRARPARSALANLRKKHHV